MAAPKRPRRGSLAFYPRKRAKRIYPSVRGKASSDKLKPLEFSGYKVGMVSVVVTDTRKNTPTKGEDIVIPATVIECPPLKVIGFRVYSENYFGKYPFVDVMDENIKKDKFIARKIKLGEFRPNEKIQKIEKNIDKIKDVSLIVKTNPNIAGIGKKTPEVFEIDIGGNQVSEKLKYAREMIGKEIKISDIFREGEYLDVIAITKGKGTQGVVKRFGVRLQFRKDMKHHRQIGTLGSQSPGRVRWTVPRAGQLGFFQRTEFNKRLLKIGVEPKEINPSSGFTNYGIVKSNYILLEGSVPGPRKRLVMLRLGIRPPKTAFLPTEIKEIIK
ncbi:MAG: 50S ribosomal protein L3 [Candidatus Aenigmatarchaeota archaeon]